jgi:oligosaccharide repeat unit polymerase
MGGFAAICRLVEGSWLAPGAAWMGAWFFLTMMPLLVAPEYPYFPSGIWVIFLLAAGVGCGGAISVSIVRPAPVAVRTSVRLFSAAQFRALMLAAVAASLYSLEMLMRPHGISLASLINPANLHSVASTLSIARYENDAGPWQMRILLCYIYLCCLLGGRYFATPSRHRWSRYYAFLPLLGSLTFIVATSARAGFLLSCLLWVGAYLPKRLSYASAKSLAGSRWLLWVLTVAVAIVGLFILAMLLRYGSETMDDEGFIFDRLKIYFAAHASVFSQWWAH